MSVCTNSTEDFRDTITNCAKAITIDASAVKAHFLRSVAYQKQNDLDNAMADIKAAIKLAPQDTKLREQF